MARNTSWNTPFTRIMPSFAPTVATPSATSSTALSQRNFNPIMAMAARVTLVEVEEEIIALGDMDPDNVHTPGVCVDRVVRIPEEGIHEEAIYRD